jgi:hypothetical protein
VTGLRQALAGYLELRRALGFKLERHAELLGQFVAWLEDHQAATVTTADALAWVTLPERASPGWLKYRMQAVRGFAAYLATLDPSAEVPPPGLLPGGPAAPCLTCIQMLTSPLCSLRPGGCKRRCASSRSKR